VHGTAPDIAGQGKANPSALILSGALLMTWWYQKTGEEAYRKAATLMEAGVRKAIESGSVTADLGGSAGTAAFADAVIKQMQQR